MSGEDIPYQLRPNKFIDRQAFTDLLSRLVPSIGADKYVYLSMGGRHLVDHNAVYRQVGVTKLFSFDKNGTVVERQKFNRPIDSAICDEMPASNLPSIIDSISDKFPDTTNVIVWLDYTDPNSRLTQLQELIEVAKRLQPGDVIRITLNSSLGSLDGPKGSTFWKDNGFPSPKEYRLSKLSEQLDTFVPADLEGIGEDEFPSVLCRCVGLSFSKVEGESGGISFKPVLLTTYKDGQRMVTVTCLVVPRSGANANLHRLQSWPFLPANWSDVTYISAPDLSLREKLKIDENLSREPNIVLDNLGFLPGSSKDNSLKAISSYQRLHRYYPSFHHVDT
ncbi:hypothetical protein LJR090_001529 [Bosea sp. LjRoot90]|uniref:O-methyltransferase n=1 Tax=Bosea sp. LjRoot90 TaxID=3342342 RepID=UPI003ECD0DA3